jgi:hypothetical protein
MNSLKISRSSSSMVKSLSGSPEFLSPWRGERLGEGVIGDEDG